VVGGPLHDPDHGQPALLVEPVLQDQPRLVTLGAVHAEDLLHAPIFVRGGWQCGEPFGSGKLVGEVLDGVEDEILPRASSAGEVDIRHGSLEPDRLGPDLVLARFKRRLERRKVELSAFIREDRSRDGLSLGAERDCNASERLIGR
jgi:hypothetical protein